ncbi:hypothetical protein MRX96_017423 [Rhipicephalus microplus]
MVPMPKRKTGNVATPACLSELLIIKELRGVPVTTREPADFHCSIGVLHGGDGDLTDSKRGTPVGSFARGSKQGGADGVVAFRQQRTTEPCHPLRSTALGVERQAAFAIVPAMRVLWARLQSMFACRRLHQMRPSIYGRHCLPSLLC